MAFIQIKNLTYTYPDREEAALDRINLEIPEGQFVLIVGGSGCGKSSLIRAICGLIPEFYGGTISGQVLLDREDVSQMNRRKRTGKVGMVFQDPEGQLVMTSVEQELVFGMENLGMPDSLMKRRLMEVSGALDLGGIMGGFAPELSGGQKQKVALAAVLAMQPEILLLDEPTSQLDPVAGEEILTVIRRLNEDNGITVVLIEQRLERCFHLADRVLVMEQGKILSDHHAPDTLARWAAEHQMPFIPPLVKLFAGAGFPEIPVTVKDGRKILRTYWPAEGIKMPKGSSSQEITGEAPRDTEKMMVRMEKLWFSYPGGKEILKDINLEIPQGSFTVLMGENGSGKTTLSKLINGLLKPDRGWIEILGRNTAKMSVEEIAPLVGYLSQNPNDYLFLPTVREEITFALKNFHLEDGGISGEITEKLGLTAHLDRNPRDLSSGERQRVALASVLVCRPKLLLLDEPTRGLDYSLKEKLGKMLLDLQKEGISILMITHDVEFAAEYAEDILLMAGGRIVGQGDKYEMLADSTFYASQVSKLFRNIADRVVTLSQAQRILEALHLTDQRAAAL
ncbi:ABC transporter ATP-binding protein [Dehalobacterium formicoaceticum]|uniref:Energy-coupling factor transporter ATPase n=1 Tax=Dehalobacterium formicoaceticum TaxID=51515 RepID=A0ABT1Y1U9_9FIRM|nr:energy-coupling factor transporter ATPase [Dehalobacterium formicoaceticum]MCR6544842.1 energy-coupling factor transporter ATPase [Dehalobacterium formicoaceticum]